MKIWLRIQSFIIWKIDNIFYRFVIRYCLRNLIVWARLFKAENLFQNYCKDTKIHDSGWNSKLTAERIPKLPDESWIMWKQACKNIFVYRQFPLAPWRYGLWALDDDACWFGHVCCYLNHNWISSFSCDYKFEYKFFTKTWTWQKSCWRVNTDESWQTPDRGWSKHLFRRWSGTCGTRNVYIFSPSGIFSVMNKILILYRNECDERKDSIN